MRLRGFSAAYKRRRFPSRKPGRCMSPDSPFSVPLQDGVGRAFEHAKPLRDRGTGDEGGLNVVPAPGLVHVSTL